MPTIEVQRRELKDDLKQQLVRGDTWLVITCTRVFVYNLILLKVPSWHALDKAVEEVCWLL